ncbi:hypothetical protein ACFYMO_00870 [Streptomyces sp. NPDC007025]|uniref:hypothetical protein n=1 Tax=Streptomyces sp. NPDC007025 TaxID=3364771 RepID=UPI00369DBAD0
MAYVIGPNGVKTYVPDATARSLVGDGERGYVYAPEARQPEPKAPTQKRTTRRTAKAAD